MNQNREAFGSHQNGESYRQFMSGTDTDSDSEYLSGYTNYTGSGSESDDLADDFVPPDRAELYRISQPTLVAKALDNTGVKTDNDHKIQGLMEATKYHLEDMRKMVFKEAK